MAKHKNYGKKPYAKFFKNKKKEPENKDDVRGMFMDGVLYLDEETRRYLENDAKSAIDMSNMFKNCNSLSSIEIRPLPSKK